MPLSAARAPQSRLLPRFALRACFGILLIALLSVTALAQDDPLPDPIPPISGTLNLAEGERAGVLVMLKPGAVTSLNRGVARFADLPDAAQTAAIAEASDRVLATPALANAQHVGRFSALPFLSLSVDAAGLAALQRSPWVERVVADGFREPALAESTDLIGLNAANGPWANGVTGTGWTVAILDTGTQKSHPFLTGKVVSEACFGTNGTFGEAPNTYILTSLCPGGATDSLINDSGLPCNQPGCDHGTHLAGIAVGKGETFQGVAPDASLISIQIFSKVTGTICNNPPQNTCIRGRDSDILRGIDRVYALRETYKIAAINLSFGGGMYFNEAQCDTDQFNEPYVVAAAKLLSVGIPIIASAGNNGVATGMEGPACVSNIISVSSVGRPGAPDLISTFANTAPFLELLAPGYQINSSVPGGAFANKDGTSMATAHVTGLYALLRQHTEGYPVTPKKLIDTLRAEGKDITDASGTYKRVRANRAFLVLTYPAIPTLQAPANDFVLNEPGLTFTWAADADTTSYRLIVRDSTDKVVYQKDVAAAACTATCSDTTATAFANKGTFTWTVRAFNEFQNALSTAGTFTTDYPGTPALTYPTAGTVIGSLDDLTTFAWTQVPAADDYEILIRNITNPKKPVQVHKAVYAPGSALACDGTACTLTLPGDIVAKFADDRRYEWRVQARSAFGKSTPTFVKFRVDIPGAPTLLLPAKDSQVTTVENLTIFRWSEIDAADSYQLTVRDISKPKNKVVRVKQVFTVGDAALVCEADACTATLAGTAGFKNNAQYDWQVQARNAEGTSNSPWHKFSTKVAPPAAPALIAPAADIVFNTPDDLAQLQWSPSAGAVAYTLLIQDVTKPKRVYPILDARYTLSDPELTCDASLCTYTIQDSTRAKLLDGHAYRWWVSAGNGFAQAASPRRPFKANFPGKPTPTTPANNVTLRNRTQLATFAWSSVEHADSYLLVMREKGKQADLLRTVVTPTTPGVTCDATSCVYTVTTTTQGKLKTKRTYIWFVEARSLYGKDRSAQRSFRTQF